jgi:hypothetical protein
VLGGISVKLAKVITSDDTSGDDIEKTHVGKSGLVGWGEEGRGLFLWKKKDEDEVKEEGKRLVKEILFYVN